ncbi:hypothetical protein A2863_03390 [Candidatus Woesebacteria bacterium RIFCSPHIGHO2_01_FULL_38_9b]|uniref:HTH merR-type domain-containing protein n=1 Tax=Candidatus Woesebacteria bacterium RIFCSPHIGHO2_01_FULL_38_9b TaxID=1802493 RepID=A0A1F7Y3T9_9BACT|nr:MAG: hypothetical protein A2863_03390 [Candidatus Woesebacteria bacterium RIFCSPHIGHO2_01_FULL_38_9b]
MDEKKDLLSIGQASEYLGVSIDTLRRWEKKGKVDSLRSPGGHRYYEKKQLDNLFGKKYERVEPTIRRSFVKKENEDIREDISSITDVKEIIQEDIFVLDRPVRGFEIPNINPVRVTREQSIPPTQVYVEETVQISQSSVLTPPAQNPVPTTPTPQNTQNVSKHSLSISFDNNKILIITAIVLFIIMVIIVLFIIRSSQEILSPIP